MSRAEINSNADLFKKIKNKLRRISGREKRQSPTDASILYTISEIKDVTFCKIEEITEPRLNIVIPSIEKEHMYGGISTALYLFEELSKNFKRSRIVVSDFPISQESLTRYSDYSIVSDKECSLDNHQIISISANDKRKGNCQLRVAEHDIFVATIWYTAYLIQKIIEWQSLSYHSHPKYFLYLIQDYEPGFYPWSGRYVLAESTYKHADKTLAVFNTGLLQSFFHERQIRFSSEYVLKPKMHKLLLNRRQEYIGNKKQRIIVVYGRPGTSRNAFSLLIDSLRYWCKTDPHPDRWKIISAGEQHADIPIGEGLFVHSAGKLSLEAYSKLMGESAIGISFMISPHPSYPPLEMSHYGMKVITNAYSNKDLSQAHDNITSLKDIRPENISQTLSNLCRQIEENASCGWEGQSHMDAYLSESHTLPFEKSIVTNLLLSKTNEEL